ncbi:MAG: bifunctional transaldolase/phosoglucose isomerase [Acidobacteriota bacterium]
MRRLKESSNPLHQLQDYGQSIWLDYIRREFITSGELRRLVEEDGLRGVTSNPTIFEKAIAGSADYDAAIRSAVASDPDVQPRSLFEQIEVEDIQMAADVLRPVFDATDGADGFVSIEVSPYGAQSTKKTIAEARRLWRVVNRPNLMVKVPSSKVGIPAVETLIAEGININITLMFSIRHYEAVAQAYIRGLERTADLQRISSVASFFVSRVDTAVDRRLEAIGTPEALALRGKIAIANAKRVYKRFKEIFLGEPFASLRQRGARIQRPLWASTGTKNPSYSDLLYVESLIGPHTVNTIPPATIDAFRDHGKAAITVEQDISEAEAALARIETLGIRLDEIAETLVSDGEAAFAASFEKLLTALKEKRKLLVTNRPDAQLFSLGVFQAPVAKRIQEWQEQCLARRMWTKDYTIWSATPAPEITDRLGWLTLPEMMHEHVDTLKAFADEVRTHRFRQVLLLGMGGSSLAAEVFQKVFKNARGYPKLFVLDSTHPAAVRTMEKQLDLARTLFLVSSKSGKTLEPLSFYRYFRERVGQASSSAGRQFVAITDPHTSLEALARQEGFRRIFTAPEDIGGRYSALSVFGLVPAALIGIDMDRVLDRAWRMAEACASCVAAPMNPGLSLGAALGELARAGRDKVTFITSPSIESFPYWIEQLIAESTGKDGKGIVPIAGEMLAGPESYGVDRVFVSIGLGRDSDDILNGLATLEAAGHPVIRIRLSDKVDLGQELFRWEMAVAAAGSIVGIHPFNQPDVELAKQLAHDAMSKSLAGDAGEQGISVRDTSGLKHAAQEWLRQTQAGDYIAIQAYLNPTTRTIAALESLRQRLRDRTKLATTCGFGPRFLHSTGQLHKGGPNTGLFLQLIDEPVEDLAVPGAGYTFGELIRAQALGDYQALMQPGRRVLRINLGRIVPKGLAGLEEQLHG